MSAPNMPGDSRGVRQRILRVIDPKLRRVRVARVLRANIRIGLGVCVGVLAVMQVIDLVSPSDPLRDPVSELALGWGGPVASTAFVVAGLAIIALAVALSDAVRSPVPSWWQTTLLSLGGMGVILLGVFPADATLIAVSDIGRLHTVAASFGLAALCLGFFVASRRMQGDSEWYAANRWLRPLSLAALALLLCTAAALAYGTWTLDPSRGLVGGIQRFLIADILLWAFLASLRLPHVVPVAR